MASKNSTSKEWKMKLKTQFTVPNKELRDLDYVKKVEVLEDAYKRECLDYPNKENCLVCCNWLFVNPLEREVKALVWYKKHKKVYHPKLKKWIW